MFKRLYSCPQTILIHCSAPLYDERLSYLRYCAGWCANQQTLCKIAVYLLHVANFLNLRVDETVNLAQIETAAQAWRHSIHTRANYSSKPKAIQIFVGHAVRFFRFLGRFEETHAPSPAQCDEVAQFIQHIRCECGWAAQTIESYRWVINRFCNWLNARGTDFGQLSIADIDDYLAGFQLSGTCSRMTVRGYAQKVRVFIRFAECQNWCMPGISEGILMPRFLPDQKIPKSISYGQVKQLLATTGTRQTAQCRARAILMVLCTYGLRAGEICALRLEDLDWQAGQLTVRCPKPGRTHRYPLSAGAGEAIADYPQTARPACEHRELFVTLRAPIRPINHSTVYSIVEHRMTMIGIADQPRGPHAIRRATAQHLLDQGMSMKMVGDYLGHRSIQSTAVYAKVDLNSLREVADFDLKVLL